MRCCPLRGDRKGELLCPDLVLRTGGKLVRALDWAACEFSLEGVVLSPVLLGERRAVPPSFDGVLLSDSVPWDSKTVLRAASKPLYDAVLLLDLTRACCMRPKRPLSLVSVSTSI